ncbi:hypothetical protein M011DRAFT_477940 [Sporormia fimetaria CBS 119925]|uniref:ACB domain-containing protein n=1 Tax=Sporormia fimetaria CBS 119925 TaxID=1340428 RepID=A0A6A6V861_9PLEO|nr:hypothetical protein M011DRAFT_477940 [Sporormia fimetaria CBS 119925]
MSDSVDRVFSHALNTVNKIRTGAQKPPTATRLKLYGLYKQAMEGNVEGIMERPSGSGEEARNNREKWEAWKQQNGLSRTEAKRRYITTLIETMHKYAAHHPDSRELVSELEFVWDQVKSNVPSSSSSSPLQTLQSTGLHMASPPHYPRLDTRRHVSDDAPLQIRSPMSQSEEELIEEDELEEEPGEEFVDAPDSQYNPYTENEDAEVQVNLTPQPPIPIPKDSANPPVPPPPKDDPADAKWKKRVEQALVRMTAEVAALREQLEARRLFSHSRKYKFFRFCFRFIWGSLKHVAVDILILGLVLLWMRRNKDRRLEGAVRVLLGDAVAQVQKVGGAQIGKIHLPKLGKKGVN